MDSSPFQYSPLSGSRCTRIIKILPALARSHPIVLHLSEIPIDDAPPYKVLSYVWGGQILDRAVLCNGMRMLITQNAEEAIRRLRRQVGSRLLWIDAICIDQKNNDEKSLQVSFMGDIYRCAEEVTVWLGQDLPSFDRLRQLHSAYRMDERMFVLSQIFSLSSLIKRLRHRGRTGDIMLFDLNWIPYRLWQAYSRVKYGQEDLWQQVRSAKERYTQHSYWERAWTVQEYILNDSCSIYSHSGKVKKLALHLYLQGGLISHPAPYLAIWGSSYHRTQSMSGPRGIRSDVAEMLAHACGLKSQFANDRVFALISVFPVLLGGVTVDYSHTASQTYANAAKAIITATGNLEVLPLACQGVHKNSTCPSWAPDWSLRIPTWLYEDPASSERYFNMRSMAAKTSQAIYRFTPSLDILYIKGLFVGEVLVSQCLGLGRDFRFWRYKPKDELLSYMGRRYEFFSGCGHDWQVVSAQIKACMERVNLHPGNWFLDLCFDPTEYISILEPYSSLDEIDDNESVSVSTYVRAREIIDCEENFQRLLQSRPVFLTAGGHFGICQDVLPGDRVVLVAGCDKAFVVRKVDEAEEADEDEESAWQNKESPTGKFRLVGEAWMSCVLNGEMWPDNEDELGEIAIV